MKKRNKISFSHLDTFYFGRCLGIDKVPESGNNPLGMETCHFFSNRIDINKKTSNFIISKPDCIITSTPVSKNNQIDLNHSSSRSSSDFDSLQSIFSIDYTSKSLQPMNPRQRIKCLKDAGVEMIKDKISTDESKYLIKLRQERQQVGCKCTGNNRCEPSKCSCSKDGIPCQSDGTNFPCKCGSKCSNEAGKRAYSNLRIKYHYKHTFERDLFPKLQENSMETQHGDCSLCNEMTDDNLQHMFAALASPKRKRIPNSRHTDLIKTPKTHKPTFNTLETLPEGVCPVVVSTVFTVATPSGPIGFPVDKLDLSFRKMERDKENINFEERKENVVPFADLTVLEKLIENETVEIEDCAPRMSFNSSDFINKTEERKHEDFLPKHVSSSCAEISCITEDSLAVADIPQLARNGVIIYPNITENDVSANVCESNTEQPHVNPTQLTAQFNDSWSTVMDRSQEYEPCSPSYSCNYWDSFLNYAPINKTLLSPIVQEITQFNPISLATDDERECASKDCNSLSVRSIFDHLKPKNSDRFQRCTFNSQLFDGKKFWMRMEGEKEVPEISVHEEDSNATEELLIEFVDIGNIDGCSAGIDGTVCPHTEGE